MINNIVEYQISINNINLGAAYITQTHRER